MPKISQLPTLENITTGSIIPVVENSITQKLSVGKLFEFLSGALDETFATETELMLTASGGNVNTSSLVTTSSFNSHSSSVNTTTQSLKNSTQSLNTFSASVILTGSIINTFSSSVNTTTASLNSYTSSNDGKWNTLGGQTGSFVTEAETGSFVTNVSMFLSKSAFDTYTGSAATAVSSAINAATSSFATTGSNIFIGNQTITGSLNVSGSTSISGGLAITNSGYSWSFESNGRTKIPNITFNSDRGTGMVGIKAEVGKEFQIETSTTASSVGPWSFGLDGTLNAPSGANITRVANLITTSSFNTFTSSLNSFTASVIATGSNINSFTASVNGKTGSFATTGSNQFNGNQTITGSLVHGNEGNIATGEKSHAEGEGTQAIGNFSHAEGLGTIAYANYSHAEGQDTIASGSHSHSEGLWTIALGNHQHVQGKYNVVSSVPAAFIVGNGTDAENRSNLIHAAGNEVQITGSLNVSGSNTFIGTNIFSGSIYVSGSVYGNVTAQPVTSNTSSIDISTANFFTITLGSSATTHISASNVREGQSVNILVTTGTNSTASFSTNIKQPSGSFYLPTSGSGNKDILSLVAFDSSNLYLVAVNQMI